MPTITKPQIQAMPWDPLTSAGWMIVGMNHYRLGGVRHLFCSMAKSGRCIVAEGTNESQVFVDLQKKAEASDRKVDLDVSAKAVDKVLEQYLGKSRGKLEIARAIAKAVFRSIGIS